MKVLVCCVDSITPKVAEKINKIAVKSEMEMCFIIGSSATNKDDHTVTGSLKTK